MPFYPWHNSSGGGGGGGGTSANTTEMRGSNNGGISDGSPSGGGDVPTTSSASSPGGGGPVVINGKETPPSLSGTPTYQQQHQQTHGGYLPLHSGGNSGGLSPIGTSSSPTLSSAEHAHYTHHPSSYTHHHHHPHHHPHHQIHMSSLQHFTNGGYGISMMTDPSFKFHSAATSGLYQQQQTGSPNSVTSDQGHHPGYCSPSSLGREHTGGGGGIVDVVATTPNEPSGIVPWSPLTPPHHPQTAHNLA